MWFNAFLCWRRQSACTSACGIAWSTKGIALPGLHLKEKVLMKAASLSGFGRHNRPVMANKACRSVTCWTTGNCASLAPAASLAVISKTSS